MSAPETGVTLGPWRFDRIDPDSLREMAVVLDDPNPIHLDAGVVAELGLGDRQVNQGPSNVGYVLNLLHESVPEGRVRRLQVRFTGNVFAGDAVVAGGTVEAVDADSLEAAVWLDVEDGNRVVEGRAVVRVER